MLKCERLLTTENIMNDAWPRCGINNEVTINDEGMMGNGFTGAILPEWDV